MIDPATRISYRELDATTREMAAAFVEAGVGKGTRVGLIMPNGVRWVQVAVALTRIGAVLVPLSTLLQPRELVAQLRVATVQVLISVEEFRGHRYLDELEAELDTPVNGERIIQSPTLPALRRVWTSAQSAALTASDAAAGMVDALTATVTASDTLAIMFTSGSSAGPKGVVHSHGNALAAVRSGLRARFIDADTRLYLPMPFFWVGGFGSGILSALLAGATLVTEEIPRPETTLGLLERERVTLFRGWPDQAEALARQADSVGADLSALREGSLEALLAPEQRGKPGARATLFGMTETFGPYCGYPADTDMPRSAWGSCGRPFEGMEVRIVDSDSGRPVRTATVGIIQVRGPHTLRGVCRRSREDLFTADGFYPTGDLGHLDADGFMFYHGRSDDMFKVSGATVYPNEVEQALRTIDGVDNAFVTNVGGANGDEVGAAVVCDTTRTTVARLAGSARKLLSSFKVPIGVDAGELRRRDPAGSDGQGRCAATSRDSGRRRPSVKLRLLTSTRIGSAGASARRRTSWRRIPVPR